nr:coordinator of PRMT5 and differentiation stimulator isoform X2 [Zootoca vivipara]
MEAAGQRESPGRLLPLPEQRKKADASAFAEQEEFEVVKTFSWRPGKGLAEHAVEKVKSALEELEDFESPYEDSESDGEDLSMPTDTALIETKTVSHYVEEDWDKELEDNENNSNPYGDAELGVTSTVVATLELKALANLPWGFETKVKIVGEINICGTA